MKIVFNSSPLIFLARLNLLKIFIDVSNEFYLPEFVIEEIKVKQDEASEYIQRSHERSLRKGQQALSLKPGEADPVCVLRL